MEFGAARFSERDQVLDLLTLWYDDPAFFARYNRNDPSFRDELCLVARNEGDIVSTVQIFDRRVRVGGQAVAMGGIGSVFTRKDFRKRGAASELMQLAVSTLEREGFELSLLFAERLKFYGGFGWQPVERKFSALTGASSLPQTGIEIRNFDPGADLARVAAIHDSYSSCFETTVVRDSDYWRGNLLYAGNPDELFVVAERQGTVAAYARAVTFQRVPMVMEYGYVPREEMSMGALFGYISRLAEEHPELFAFDPEHRGEPPRDSSEEGSRLASHTAHDPGLEKFLTDAGLQIHHHADNHFMWRVINADKIGERLGCAASEASRRFMELVRSGNALYWTADRF